jgi:hypothetical protein
MSTNDSTPEEGSSNGIFEVVAPLTGENPNLASFFLVVGAVTCVFIAVFQLTLPEGVRLLLTGGVLLVTVLSAIVASLLETLGYFDEETSKASADEAETGTGTEGDTAPWTPTSGTRYPLPPMINFDDELRTYREMFDGELPAEFDEFVAEYKRLKTTRDNRTNVASDLRADLNPVSVLFEERSRGMEIHDDISERLLRYVNNDAIDYVSLTDVGLYDDSGDEIDVASAESELAHLRADIENEGETVAVELFVEFVDGDGNGIRRDTYPVGEINPAATETFDSEVYVPAAAERATTSLSVTNRAAQAASR